MSTFIKNDTTPNNSSIATQSAINHRVLLSLPEAAKIIGTKGSTIEKIRTDHNVKIGISEKIQGCSDRILSCAGTVINVADALAEIMTLINEDPELRNRKYPFHYLNHILPLPSPNEVSEDDQSDLDKIGTLRLLMLNSHLSSIIGRNGHTIKGLIDKHGVKIVASREFLPGSSERILEIQGFPGSVANTLVEISEILVKDIDITFSSDKRYFPHLKTPNGNSGGNSNSSSSSDETTSGDDGVDLSELEVLIPEAYVGAVVGRQGNRIANLRKFTRTKIIIEKHDSESSQQHPQKHNENGEPCRTFTIIGNSLNRVKLAETMLLKNLQTEIERRNERKNNTNKADESENADH